MNFDDTLAARKACPPVRHELDIPSEVRRCNEIAEHNRIEDRKRAVHPTRTFKCPTRSAIHLREIPVHVCPPTSWRVKVAYAMAGAGLMFMAVVMATWAMWGVVVAGAR